MSHKERPTFYRQELNKTIWEVPERYQSLSPVGSGAYGSVCSSYDVKSGLKMAVKKLSRPFQSIIHAKRTYRELRLLKHMKHENVIGLLDVFTPATSLEEFNDVYLVTHLMGADLNNIIKCQKLTDDHVQFLIYQILRGLKYIHSADIIHRVSLHSCLIQPTVKKPFPDDNPVSCVSLTIWFTSTWQVQAQARSLFKHYKPQRK
eukprot:XP_013989432.1 PREDICTED: mitogen-activated protein kinase 14A-like [Salmo salar]